MNLKPVFEHVTQNSLPVRIRHRLRNRDSDWTRNRSVLRESRLYFYKGIATRLREERWGQIQVVEGGERESASLIQFPSYQERERRKLLRFELLAFVFLHALSAGGATWT